MYERNFGIFRDPDLRASDAEREAMGERLRRHHADGRIDSDEFQERIDRCYSAKTVGELDQLVADVPSEQRITRTRHRFSGRLGPIPVIPLVLGIVAVSAAVGWHHHGGFGFLWLIPVLFVVRMCLWRRVRRWDTL